MDQIQLQIQKLKASQVLRQTEFFQHWGGLASGDNGRCAVGVLASYLGWNGKYEDGEWLQQVDDIPNRYYTNNLFRRVSEYFGLDANEIVIRNDVLGKSFKEIADWLEEKGL